MKVGVNMVNFGPGTTPASLRSWAQISESLGYHLIMASDHIAITPDIQPRYPAPFYEPISLLGWLDNEAPALPDESSTNSATPCSWATDSMVAVPLSLNDPVGFRNSSFACNRFRGKRSPMVLRMTQGVFPSPRVTAALVSCTGVGTAPVFASCAVYATSRGEPQAAHVSADISAGRETPHFGQRSSMCDMHLLRGRIRSANLQRSVIGAESIVKGCSSGTYTVCGGAYLLVS